MRKLLTVLTVISLASVAHANLWINEIDYDTPGTDTNEWVELAGSSGTSLDNYELVMINQAGTEYGVFDLADASYTFADENNGYGFFVIGIVNPAFGVSPDYTPAGWTQDEMQNGTTDSIQLRLKAGPVNVHLLDYEGDNAFTTDDQNTALADNSTDVQTTLYLTGSGNDFSDFTWDNGQDNGTPGAVNFGQSIAAIPEPTTAALYGLALGAIVLYRRKRR